MSLYRFWLRCCLVFCPFIFLLLYMRGVSLTYSLLSAAGVAVVGILLILPFIFVFNNVDRSMWSPEEEIKRKLRYQQKLREWEGHDDDDERDEEEDER